MKYIILILFFIPIILFSQGWTRIYGGDFYDVGYDVQQISNGGYIIIGYTNSYGNGERDVYLIKTDSNGDSLWTKTFGGEYSDLGYSVQQTTDGGYIIVGFTHSYGNGEEDVYLIKTDSNGDTLWTNTFGGEYSDLGLSVQQTTDNGYIIVGYTNSYGNGEEDVYLIKTDSNGDTLWTKTFGGNKNDMGYSVQQTTDGGYIITGSTYSYGNGRHDVYLIKTNSNGDSIWTKTFGNEYLDRGYCVQQTTDDGYIICGTTIPSENAIHDVYLIKTDSNGDTLWTKTFDVSEFDSGNFVQQTIDGGYIVTGSTVSIGNGGLNVYLIKTDYNGDTLWTKTFGGEYSDLGYSVQQTTDGGYIIAATTEYFGYLNYDVYLIKTDGNGIVTFTTDIPVPKTNRKLIKTVDISGKKIKNLESNQLYIEIYDDGTTKKKIKLK